MSETPSGTAGLPGDRGGTHITGDVHGLVMGDHNVIFQYFYFAGMLQGIAPDHRKTIRRFIEEYLGSESRPVPFGGRDRDLAALDQWLISSASPYQLLSGPAGQGKSALLVRWTTRLIARGDVEVVFIPVSIRYGTNLAGVFYSALAARLADIHREAAPGTGVTVGVLREQVSDYLRRALPGGRPLVIVIDGLDEAAGWEIGASLLPVSPQGALRIVAAARLTSERPTASHWLRHLGWDRPDLAMARSVGALAEDDVKNLIAAQLGNAAVDELAASLYRLSEGDPLLLSLYVRDLISNPGQGASLAATPSGLHGYFQRWWEQQEALWKDTYGDEAQRIGVSVGVRGLMNVFSQAFGPLSSADLSRLIPDRTPAEIGIGLVSLARFLLNGGQGHGYVLGHSRLGEYWAAPGNGRMSDDERRQLQQRFADYGLAVARDLRSGELRPQVASRYAVQYLRAHLDAAEAGPEERILLVHDAWRQAWKRLDGTDTGFLSDVRACRAALARCNSQAAPRGDSLPYLSEEIRCILCESSVVDQTRGFSPALLAALVRFDIWSPAQALAYARQQPGAADSAKAQMTLAQYLPNEITDEIFAQAIEAGLRTALEEGDYGELLAHVLESGGQFGPALRELARKAVMRIPYADVLAYIVHGVLPLIDNDEQRSELLARFEDWDLFGGDRAPETFFREKGDDPLNTPSYDNWETTLLAALSPILPPAEREEALRRSIDKSQNDWGSDENCDEGSYRSVARFLPQDRVPELLVAQGDVHEQEEVVQASLVPYLAPGIRKEMVSHAFAGLRILAGGHEFPSTMDPMAEQLGMLVEHVPDRFFPQLVSEALVIDRAWPRAQAIAGLVANVPARERERLLAAARDLPHHRMKTEVYRAAADSDLPDGERALYASLAVEHSEKTGDELLWARALDDVATALPTDALPALNAVALQVRSRPARLTAIAALVGAYLADGRTADALTLAGAVRDDRDRRDVLLRTLDDFPPAAHAEVVRLFTAGAIDLRWLSDRLRRFRRGLPPVVADGLLDALLNREGDPQLASTLVEVLRLRAMEPGHELSERLTAAISAIALSGGDPTAETLIAASRGGELAEQLVAEELVSGTPNIYRLGDLADVVSLESLDLIEAAIPRLHEEDRTYIYDIVTESLLRRGEFDRVLVGACQPTGFGDSIGSTGFWIVANSIRFVRPETIASVSIEGLCELFTLADTRDIEMVISHLSVAQRIELYEKLRLEDDEPEGEELEDEELERGAFERGGFAAAAVAMSLSGKYREQAIHEMVDIIDSDQDPTWEAQVFMRFLPSETQDLLFQKLLDEARRTSSEPQDESNQIDVTPLLPFLSPTELRDAVPIVLGNGTTTVDDISVLQRRLAACGDPSLLTEELEQLGGERRQLLLIGLAMATDDGGTEQQIDGAKQMVREALAIAERIGDGVPALTALSQATTYMSPEESPGALDGCLRRYYALGSRARTPEILWALARQMKPNDRETFLREIITTEDDARGFFRMVNMGFNPSMVPKEGLSPWVALRLLVYFGMESIALELLESGPDDIRTERAFEVLASELSESNPSEALDLARRLPLGAPGRRALLLAGVASQLDPDAAQPIVAEALAAAGEHVSLDCLRHVLGDLPLRTGPSLDAAIDLALMADEHESTYLLAQVLTHANIDRVRALVPVLDEMNTDTAARLSGTVALRLCELGGSAAEIDLLLSRLSTNQVRALLADLADDGSGRPFHMPRGSGLDRLVQAIEDHSVHEEHHYPDALASLASWVDDKALARFRADPRNSRPELLLRLDAEMARRATGNKSRQQVMALLDQVAPTGRLMYNKPRYSLIFNKSSTVTGVLERLTPLLSPDLTGRAMVGLFGEPMAGLWGEPRPERRERALRRLGKRIAEFNPPERGKAVASVLHALEGESRETALAIISVLMPALIKLGRADEGRRLFEVIDEAVTVWP